MRKLHQVTMLGLALLAVGLLAAPLAAAEFEGPLCTAGVAGDAVAAPEVAPVDGVAPADPPAAAVGTPEPQPLFDPVPVPPGSGGQCGLVVCPIGTRCCNPLCSACTPPGVECTLGDCGHGPTS